MCSNGRAGGRRGFSPNGPQSWHRAETTCRRGLSMAEPLASSGQEGAVDRRWGTWPQRKATPSPPNLGARLSLGENRRSNSRPYHVFSGDRQLQSIHFSMNERFRNFPTIAYEDDPITPSTKFWVCLPVGLRGCGTMLCVDSNR
jgi:hypothetical protein